MKLEKGKLTNEMIRILEKYMNAKLMDGEVRAYWDRLNAERRISIHITITT
jgi:uncharacterized protein YqeY